MDRTSKSWESLALLAKDRWMGSKETWLAGGAVVPLPEDTDREGGEEGCRTSTRLGEEEDNANLAFFGALVALCCGDKAFTGGSKGKRVWARSCCGRRAWISLTLPPATTFLPPLN
eukprot:630930-Pelagomonas_calceolata.AAC.1